MHPCIKSEHLFAKRIFLKPGECCSRARMRSVLFSNILPISLKDNKNKPEILLAAFASLVPDLNVELIRCFRRVLKQ